MQQPIATSEGTDTRTYALLALNILGVAGCFSIMVMLTLWALGVIYPEPDVSEPIRIFIDYMRAKNKSTAWRTAEDGGSEWDTLLADLYYS